LSAGLRGAVLAGIAGARPCSRPAARRSCTHAGSPRDIALARGSLAAPRRLKAAAHRSRRTQAAPIVNEFEFALRWPATPLRERVF